MWDKNEQEIKDEVFLDNFCFVLDIYENKFRIPMIIELKIGILIFSEYKDFFQKIKSI